MPLTLRPATEADVADIARLWGEGWPDGHLGHVPDELVAARTPESFRQRVRTEDTTVAVLDGAVVGFVMIDGDEVEQVYVDRSARGTGAASALLADATARIRAAGHVRAWLAVVPGNARARHFYEREGWTDEGGFTHVVPGRSGTLEVPCRRMAMPLHGRG